MVRTNMLGTIFGAKVAAVGMQAQGGGQIVNILGGGSDGRFREGQAIYGSTKRGLNLFTVPDRLADGDPWAGIDEAPGSIEPLLALYEEQGSVEMPFPPDHPKMPGEPPRVQPSKKVAEHWDEQGNRIEQ